MRIATYGATGNAGSRVVAEAVRRGHTVTAISRHERQASLPDGVTWQRGDAADSEAVTKAAADHDVVVAAFGPSREPGGDPGAYTELLRGFAAAVGTTRLVVVGGAGSLLDESGRRLVDTLGFPPGYKAEALAHADALDTLRSTGAKLDWTYLSPAPEIGPGERSGSYRVGSERPVGEFVSFEDYAVALLDEIEKPAHRRARFTVAR